MTKIRFLIGFFGFFNTLFKNNIVKIVLKISYGTIYKQFLMKNNFARQNKNTFFPKKVVTEKKTSIEINQSCFARKIKIIDNHSV